MTHQQLRKKREENDKRLSTYELLVDNVDWQLGLARCGIIEDTPKSICVKLNRWSDLNTLRVQERQKTSTDFVMALLAKSAATA